MELRQKIRTIRIVVATILIANLAAVSVGCGQKMTPVTVAANVGAHGKDLMTAVKKVQQAVIDAEAAGALPRNNARDAMVVFQRIGANGEKAADLLDKLVTLAPESTESKTTVQQIQAALDLVSSDLFQALVPINNDTTRNQVITLAAEVSKTITIINREILGGVQ